MLTTLLIFAIWLGMATFVSFIACMLSSKISQKVPSNSAITPFLKNRREAFHENPARIDSWQ